MASSSADSGKCLGSASSGRVGTVVEYDGSDLPFKVECNGSNNWYTQEQLVLATAGGPSKMAIGQRVVRGPNWQWGNQDGGAGNAGVCVEIDGDGWTRVKWDKGGTQCYKNGLEGCYDLAPVPGAVMV